MLSRDKILAFKDVRIGTFDVPEFGGEIGLACFTVAEADKARALFTDSADGKKLDAPAVAVIVMLGACDKDGKRLFGNEDLPTLANLPASALGPLANAILSHNGFGGADEAKNGSSATASEDSAIA